MSRSKDKTYTVYFHTNIDNNKVYVGITSQKITSRWGKNGKKYLEKKKDGDFVQPKFARAILKYGWEGFTHTIFAEGLSCDEACLMEMTLIELYDSAENGYNITKGGEGTIGVVISEEECKKRSERFKGRRMSPDTEFKAGHSFTPEMLQKMSEAKKGKPSWNKGLKGFGAGEKNAMKRPEVRAKFKGAKNASARKVIQLDMDGNFIKEWDYMTQVQEELSFNVANLTACCRGRIKSAYGYKWKYTE